MIFMVNMSILTGAIQRKKPTDKGLQSAWNDYVALNGTPEQQQAQEEIGKQEALDRLKLSTSSKVADLLKVIG